MILTNNPLFINNSDEYIKFSSLFEDFESIDKLARQRIEENNISALLRCINMTKMIVNELKSHIM